MSTAAGQGRREPNNSALAEKALATMEKSGTPAFHAGGTKLWNALPGTLRLIMNATSAGARTIETGAGASTVIFAAAGADHTAISPASAEHDRIAAYCKEQQVDASRITFIAESSDVVLPTLPLDPRFDVAFIDGRHAFPAPTVDFHYLEQRLAVGGVMILDDAPYSAVRPVHRFMHSSPQWAFMECADNRAVAYRKLGDAPVDDTFSKSLSYWFLPPRQRAAVTVSAGLRRAQHVLGDRYPKLRKLKRAVRG